MDIDMAEAIMRVEVGSEVNNLSSKELKRDLLLFARRNPKLFIRDYMVVYIFYFMTIHFFYLLSTDLFDI